MHGKISDIIPCSIAAELGISPGDQLVSINDQLVSDIIDYGYFCNDEALLIELKDINGQIYFCQVEKDADEDLGLVFQQNLFDGMRSCCNHCLFCFMEQLPPQARQSLHVKDDDYRMSFLQGNYITGTNLREQDIERIEKLRLSPLYFSIHSTDLPLRRRLLGNAKAKDIMPLLRHLTQNGIIIHGQIVLCPDLNDGEALARTLADIESLGENIQSLALVPVGLTKYQKNKCMRLFDKIEACRLIEFVQQKQAFYKEKRDSAFVFLADEFYLLAEKPFPNYEHYEDFPQLENGVGMCRTLLDEWQKAKKQLPLKVEEPREFLFLTGKSAYKIMLAIAQDLSAVQGLQVNAVAVENKFFGSSITVAGLLTSTCIKAALSGRQQLPTLILPSTVLKFDQDIFLDDGALADLQQELQTEILIIEPNAKAIIAAVCC